MCSQSQSPSNVPDNQSETGHEGNPTELEKLLADILEEIRFKRKEQQQRRTFFGFLIHHALPIAISIVALAFTILSLFASWKALDLARKANGWSYYAYEAALVGVRLSLMQLCAMNLTIYTKDCDKVKTWDYVSDVDKYYHPKNETPPVLNTAAPSTVPFFPAGAVAFGVAILVAALLPLYQLNRKYKMIKFSRSQKIPD